MGNRNLIGLECTECKRRNYTTDKNKKTTPDKLVLRKFCAFCGGHREHKECKV